MPEWMVLALAGCVLAACAAGLWILWAAVAQQTQPAPAAKPAELTLEQRVAELTGRVDSLFKLRLEWNEVLAELEDLTETVERKRRRAAASAAKAAGAAAEDGAESPGPRAAPRSLDEVLRRARARGIA